MITLYNPGPREIDGFRIDGFKVTLLANQQKDFPSEIGKLVSLQFDFVQIKGEYEEGVVKPEQTISVLPTVLNPEPVKLQPVVQEQDEDELGELVPNPSQEDNELEQVEQALVETPNDVKNGLLDPVLSTDPSDPANSAICAICDKEFKNVRGYRIHLKHIHNA